MTGALFGWDWGDVPTWVGSVVTSGSVLLAAVAYRRSVRDKEREQASKVAAWFGLSSADSGGNRFLRVANSSDAPVYELIVRVPGTPELHLPDLAATSSTTLELQGTPGERAIKKEAEFSVGAGLNLWVISLEVGQTKITETVIAEPPPEIQFRDAVGRWWKRDEKGRLSSIVGPTRSRMETRIRSSMPFSRSSASTETHKAPPEAEPGPSHAVTPAAITAPAPVTTVPQAVSQSANVGPAATDKATENTRQA